MSEPVSAMTPTPTETPQAAPPESAPGPTPAAPSEQPSLHDDPAIAKALEGLTPEQRETLLTTGGKNALAARLQDLKDAKAQATAAKKARDDLAQTIGKALGIVQDEPVDPAKLTEQLTTTAAEAKQAKTELAIFRIAALPSVAADAAALLDSRSFMAAVADIDPADTAGITAAVEAATAANPALKLAPARRVPAPNPAVGSSASGAPGLDEQIIAAKKAGDVKTWMHLENQKLAAPSR